MGYRYQHYLDNPDKFIIDFFVLDNRRYYFFGQGKNSSNMEIDHCSKQLPTTTKAVINTVLASNIANDHFEQQNLFLETCMLVQSSMKNYFKR